MADDEAVKHEKPRYSATINDVPKFDLTSYISNYRGRTVFRRLFLIASCSTILREEAARLAVAEAKRGSDVTNYRDALELLQSITGSATGKEAEDAAWVAQQQKKNDAETKRLENELRQYKNNLIRESIRMGNEDAGVHYHNIGELNNATKAYSRMRDYCTTPAHIASTAFRIISVSIEQRNWLAVQSQVSKLRNLQMKPEETTRNQPRITTAMGLQHMALGEYKDAATCFLNAEPSLGESYNEVLTSNDVAVYGGLCALVSMSRSELQSKVLENNNFRSFLELEPHIRRAINSFVASKYSQCLEILESYRADYLLDIYLQDRVADIYQRVRTKSIVQYFQPFSRVTLDSMEKMFGSPTTTTSSPTRSTDTSGKAPESAPQSKDRIQSPPTTLTSFQSELAQLISSNRLQARLDLESNVLVAYSEPQRVALQTSALNTVDSFILEARIKLLRLNTVNGGLEVKPNTKKGAVSAVEGLVDVETNGNAFSAASNGNLAVQGYSLRSGRG